MNGKSIIKFLLSIGMLFLVLRRVDFSQLQETLLALPTRIAVTVILLYTVGQLISSFKWWMIARAGGIKVPYQVGLRSYFIGMFVNCFGLGMIGGDIARGVLIAQGVRKKTEGVASVIVDRLQGLVVLGIIGIITNVFFGNTLVSNSLVALLFCLVGGLIAIWAGTPLFLTMTGSYLPKAVETKLRQVALIFPRDPKVILQISLVSVAFHLLQISLHMIMAIGMGIDIPWPYLFSVIPFVNIAASLPISWNGLGVRESSYIYFLSPHIISQEQALVFGALWIVAVTISSAIGGIVALLSGDLKVLEEIEEEETSEALLSKEKAEATVGKAA